MTLFGKLKNLVTGGGAKVTLEVLSPPARGQAFGVRVEVVVGETDLTAHKVYLRVIGEEEVQVPNVEVAVRSGDQIRVATETVVRSSYTFDATWDVAPAQTLRAKQSYQWEIGLEIPADAQACYQGQLARHEWKILAGVDVFGNDPDTGWFVLEMG